MANADNHRLSTLAGTEIAGKVGCNPTTVSK